MKLLILFVVIMILGYYSQDSTDFERERLVRKLRDMGIEIRASTQGAILFWTRATLWATLLTILVVVLTLMTIHHG